MRGWFTIATIGAAVVLGAQVWGSYTLAMDAVSDPLGEAAAQSVVLGPMGAVSTIFVPECATAIVVRFDPSTALQGDVTASLALNEPGGRFAAVPVFETTGRLETMAGGVWTLTPPLSKLSGRFVQVRLRAADMARASLLTRAAPAVGHGRVSLDDRWAPRATIIAGAVSRQRDPLRCVAAHEPIPRVLRLPLIAFLGSIWLLTVAVAGWWLWPRPSGAAQASTARSE